MRSGAAAVGLGLALAAAFYLLLIDTVSAPELYAGAGVIVMTAVILAVTCERRFPQAAIRLPWLARGWRAVVRIPVQVVLVSWIGVVQVFDRRKQRGALREVPFDAGDDAVGAGRAALAELLGSLAPNGIVVGVDPERRVLLVHQLQPRGGRDELDVLMLG
jgi:multisubunit Na+/H+ antiporter MnhE subunit